MKIILLMLFFWFITSCTTMRNAERRHDRIVNNFPNVHQVDTVEVEQTIYVSLPSVTGVDTFFYPIFTKDTIVDTIFFDNDIRLVTYEWIADEQRKARKTEIYQPERVVETKIKEKRVTVFEKSPLKWWQRKPSIISFVLIAFFFGRFLSKIDERIK